jgi:hypothetical protein
VLLLLNEIRAKRCFVLICVHGAEETGVRQSMVMQLLVSWPYIWFASWPV